MTEQTNVQTLFGIPLFACDEWDEAGEAGDLMFYDVEFKIPELQKENGKNCNVSLNIRGEMEVYSKEDTLLFKGYVSDFESFRKEMANRH